ncbi:MAG: aminotransferase class I/II-fold pyridoxal phosphate-dependent enzyme [Candidatus Eisenbacteria bacterium]
MSTPIVHSSTFAFASLEAMLEEKEHGPASAYYQREGHPTVSACEERLAALEGAEMALLFSSGMAALSCLFLSLLKSGDHVVALDQCYGGTHGLLQWGAERLGWRYDLVDGRRPETWDAAFTPETKVFHVESPTNPILCVVDLHHAAQLAHGHGASLTVDNTVASPVGQHPLSHGADFVMHSATKSIGGHADLLAGVVMGRHESIQGVWKARKVFGPMPDPGLAWMIERSLKTLPLRVEACNGNALELAVRLETHPAVARVYYPGLIHHPNHEIARRQMMLGFGPLLSFDVQGGAEAGHRVVNALKLFRFGPSLGGVESLATLPAHTSHVQLGAEGRERAGIDAGCIRLSVGLEETDDLWADLDQALAGARPPG